jgi:hypothetical protein
MCRFSCQSSCRLIPLLATVADGWWRSPWTYVRLLCLVSLSVFVGALAYQLRHPEATLLILVSTSLTVFLASLTIGMRPWLLSHTAEAKLRRDSIYRPLYDEMLRAIDDLNSCRTTSLPKWHEIKGSSLSESVAPKVTEAMQTLVKEFEEYTGVWEHSLFVARKVVHSVLNEQLQKAAKNSYAQLTEEDRGSSWNRIYETILRDNKFLFDPDYMIIFDPKTSGPTNMGRILDRLISQAGYYTTPSTAPDILGAVKADLSRPGTEVTARITALEKLMPKVEAARELLRERIKRPLP